MFLLLAVGSSLTAQQWSDQKRDGDNVLDAIELYEAEMGEKEYEKGLGMKQFERWRNFWEPRLFPSGDFSVAKTDYFKSILEGKQISNNAKDGADWESLGLETWTTTSYGPGNGRINCIHPDPDDPDILYVGTPSGGLWRSNDTGANWTALTDKLPTLGVSAIAVDHSNSDVIYIATGDSDGNDTYGIGVLKSSDAGETWNSTGLAWNIQDNIRSHRLLMHPENNLMLLAATTDGLYKTINGGLTWQQVLSGLVYDIEFKPNDPNVVYATKDRFYKSDNGGDSFSPINGQLPNASQVDRMAIAVTAAEPDYVYCLVADDFYSAFSGLYRSVDGGSNWELRSDSPNILSSNENGNSLGGQAWYDMEIAVSQTEADRIITGGVNLWESNDGGQNWGLNSHWYYEGGMSPNYVHADIHHLEFEGDLLYCGSDGGIFRSEDAGGSFDDLSAGLVISQFYGFDVNDSDDSMILGGTQDNGTNLLEGGSWTHALGADGMNALIDPEDDQIMYACSQNGAIHKSINGGATFNWSSSGITEDGAWVTPYIMSPVNNDVLFAGYTNVWRSNNGAGTWSPISTDINQQLRSLAMGTNSPNTIYTASYTDIFRTTNGGGQWDNVSAGLPNEAITSIVAHPLDGQVVWITFSGFGAGEKVYKSITGGDTWVNISGNLPNIPINCIALDPQNEDGIYIGTDGGIYYINNVLANWETFSDGLPNVIVNQIEVHAGSGNIFAATHGRGVWQSPPWTPGSEAPQVDFDWFPIYICEGESVQFTDLSSGNSPAWDWAFDGGFPESSNEASPLISYLSAGVYDFSLTVGNLIDDSIEECFGCIVVLPAAGASTPLAQGFEDADDLMDLNWFEQTPSETAGWEITDQAAFSGSNSVYINNHSLDFPAEYELISIPLDMSDVPVEETAFLSFRFAYCQMSSNNNDRLRLYISEDCSQTWSLRKQWQGNSDLQTAESQESEFFPDEGQWIEEVYEIPATDLSATTSFMFRFTSDNGNNIYIDDINIWTAEVSVQEWSDLAVSVFPNPFNEYFTIESGTSCDWQVYDVMGKVVDFGSSSENTFKVDSSTWPKGVYSMKMNIDGRDVCRNLVKQ